MSAGLGSCSRALALCTLLASGCDGPREPAPAASAGEPASEPVSLPSPAVSLSEGFRFSPGEETAGFPGVLTIDLGPRLRIFTVTAGPTPAVLTLIGADGRDIRSVRMDLPPGGTVRAPEGFIGPEVTSVRLDALAMAGGGSAPGESVIGALGRPEALKPTNPVGGEVSSSVVSADIGLQPMFGTVKVWALPRSEATTMAGVPADVVEVYSGSFVADAWSGEGPPPDAHWLTERVRAALAALKGAFGAPKPAFAPPPTAQ